MLEVTDLAAAAEWEPPAGCWIVLRAGEGQAYWLGPGETLEVGPGTVMILPPTRAGVLRASQLSACQFQWFRFCPDLMGGVLTMSELHLFKRQRLVVRLFPATHEVARSFEGLVLPEGAQNGFLTRGRMLEMLGLVFGCEMVRKTIVEGSVLSASKRIQVLMGNLTEEEFIQASVEELAAWCGCSVRHFSRLFRHEFGVSLRERQTESRLVKAGRLLAETDSRVMTIALECGYRHLGVFNALFKERFGMTPTDWRRRGGGPSGETNAACETAPSRRAS